MKFELLSSQHDRSSFDCGNVEINQFLITQANQQAKKGISKTHVLVSLEAPAVIIGFYSLSSLSLSLSLKGFPKIIPAMLIGKLGVDVRFQKQGFSKVLLAQALKKIKQYAQEIGIAFVVIDAKDEKLSLFYQQFGFETTTVPLRLILPVSKI
ncbi:GNAT family N-acetyltransferase [Pasteurellaceae bacterium USgator11]|nr:GNAT family N-acetyltransferase [Pasteurellaceae bacterium UScroc12]TNG97762.1 GNAT family N-acetyltransferase [Pasteurellaceae bacterium USgator41]TNG99141.1 GNAT family N-acetyltransferase [Pasteurellaceae bacterium UScroc31]TNH03056.1 GNAT family N-acetyltransferase [Pasteurellaceae bacterium USgator11]